jgi:hypothetical protein
MLSVQKKGNGFIAKVSPPHSRKAWETRMAISEEELARRLSDLGVPFQDFDDAINIVKRNPGYKFCE